MGMVFTGQNTSQSVSVMQSDNWSEDDMPVDHLLGFHFEHTVMLCKTAVKSNVKQPFCGHIVACVGPVPVSALHGRTWVAKIREPTVGAICMSDSTVPKLSMPNTSLVSTVIRLQKLPTDSPVKGGSAMVTRISSDCE